MIALEIALLSKFGDLEAPFVPRVVILDLAVDNRSISI